ncbi:MAG: TonB-dependent receptor [Dysgonamonadaceae bacterium]|jgi:TonB-linked SusC/RagA family outer membrane protein|nr:TonB-dependent receptor [Dysgonamonadaceae bacterium]
MLFFLLNWGLIQAKDLSAQTVTAIFRNTTLNEIIWELKKQTDFTFVYNTNDIQKIKIKYLEFNNKPVKAVLDACLENTDLTYQISDDAIIIRKTAKAPDQTYTIEGKVVSETGESAIGASITVKETKKGTITNENGSFVLQVDRPAVTLQITYVGYEQQEVKVNVSSGPVTIILKVENAALDEVVVVGYGTQKKLTLTGSTTSVSGASLQQNSSVNLSQGLAGRLSGVIVNNRSGEPGNDDAIMFIRGRSTLGDNSPLIIIDGVAGREDEFSRLTGDEIESVTVLKDASAAIYGSRSANGVILVTTKRGAKNSAPKIEFTYDLGLQQPTRMVKMSDAVLYATAYNAALAIDKDSPKYSDEEIQKYRDGSDLINYPNTDWFDEMIKNLSAQHKYGVSVRGGTDRIAYFLAINGQYQDGIYHKSATNYKQYGIRTNIDFNVTNRFKVGADLSARQQHKNYSAFPSDEYGIFYITTRSRPTAGAYYPNGMLRGGTNPAIMVQDKTGYDRNKISTINAALSANLDLGALIEGLSVEGRLAYDIVSRFRKNWQQPWTYYSYDQVSEQYDAHTSSYWPTASLREYYYGWNTLTLNAIANYDRTFAGAHRVGAMVGVEQSSYRYDTFNASRSKYSSDAIDELFAGDADKNFFGNDGSAKETARRSFFGRINYDYKSKYMVSFIARYDGSENFPKEHRWGFFPGVSAGWRLSEENFIKDDFDWLTNLKLRASYGEQGNDNINPFQYLVTYQYSTSTQYKEQMGGSDVSIVIPGTIPNPDVTWEVAKTWNAGLDGDIKNGLFSWEVEWFKTRRSNILCTRNASVPYYSGLDKLPDENIGIVDNTGFELQLSHSKRVNNDFKYNLKGNFLYAKNTIKYMDETPWGEGYDYMRLEGHPMGSQLYYQVLGVNKTEDDLKNYPQMAGATLGDFIYADLDGDKVITNKDRKRCDLTPIPQIVFGTTINMEWKNFDLMILLQGQARARFYYAPLCDPRSSNLDENAAEKAWTLTNTSSDYPRIGSTVSNGSVYRNSFYYKNAAFLRFKNLEIGYTLPKALLEKLGITNTRIYIGGYNLFTIDGLKFVDPENSDEEVQTYPQLRVFNAGFKLTF